MANGRWFRDAVPPKMVWVKCNGRFVKRVETNPRGVTWSERQNAWIASFGGREFPHQIARFRTRQEAVDWRIRMLDAGRQRLNMEGDGK